MPVMVRLRWFAFASYLFLISALPPSLLWGLPGAACGALVAFSVLAWLRRRGVARLCSDLKAHPVSKAQAPALHALVAEYSRRLKLQPPGIRVIETPGLNVAVVGFSPRDAQLIFTRGILDKMSRPLLSALAARALCRVWGAEYGNETWLARFFSALQLALGGPPRRNPSHSLTVQQVAKQVLCYPTALFPAFVLKGHHDEGLLDKKSVEITQDPQSLAEAFRRLEALSERIPFQVPFGFRHLFLAPPTTSDPMARILFATTDFGDRIHAAENRFRTAPAT